MSQRISEVEAFLAKSQTWQRELRKLRTLALGCGLTETLKWNKPCYTFEGGNVAVLYRLKACAALGFLRGSLLEDPEGILVSPGQHSQAMRRLQFQSAQEIADRAEETRQFIHQAIELHRSGQKVEFKEKQQLQLPVELLTALQADPSLHAAFFALTPGRQRGYVLHVSGAKQSTTRASRVAKCEAKIRAGKGFQER